MKYGENIYSKFSIIRKTGVHCQCIPLHTKTALLVYARAQRASINGARPETRNAIIAIPQLVHYIITVTLCGSSV